MLTMTLQVLGVLLANAAAAVASWWCGGLKKPWWPIAYIVGLAMLTVVGLANHFTRLMFMEPFASIMAGRREFVLMGMGAGLLLATLVRKADRRTYKVGLTILFAAGVSIYSIGPFFLPMFQYNAHLKLVTNIKDGFCYQTTEYTCGPAAAVTAMRVLGVEAQEGALAIACATTSTVGTQPDSLAAGIEMLYGDQGVHCRYRYYDDLAVLAAAPKPVIVVVKFGFLVDHYITVLDVRDDVVVTADPLCGMRPIDPDGFMKIWKRQGVECRRDGYQPGHSYP